MADIATVFDATEMSGDLVLSGGELLADEGLESAILHSLFSDRRAHADDVLPDPGGGKRGWWANLTLPNPGDNYGSRLWLLYREKQLSSVVSRAKEYADEALAWLVADGVASEVNVSAEVVRRGVLGLHVEAALVRGNVFVEDYLMSLEN